MKKPERLMGIAVILLATNSLLQMWGRKSAEQKLERQCELSTGFTVIHANLSHYDALTNGKIAQVQNNLRLQISGQLERLIQRHGVAVVSNYLGETFLSAKSIGDQVNAQATPAGVIEKQMAGSRTPTVSSASPKH